MSSKAFDKRIHFVAAAMKRFGVSAALANEYYIAQKLRAVPEATGLEQFGRWLGALAGAPKEAAGPAVDVPARVRACLGQLFGG